MLIKIDNDGTHTYPYEIKMLKADNPNTSFPAEVEIGTLAAYGVLPVKRTNKPEGDVVTAGQPEQGEDGQWYQAWETRSYTQAELDQQLADKRASMRVTKRQGRQQMILMGILPSVQAAIDSIEDATQRLLVQSFWDDSTEYERNHSQMIQLAQAIGLTDEQLDSAFIEAAKL